jgi:hypothetical protein
MTRSLLVRCAWLGAGIVVSGFGTTSAFADEVRSARYGVIEAANPGSTSGGLFGLGTKPAVAYTIRLLERSDPVVVTSQNAAFLAGDCVAVEGKGDDAQLLRAPADACKRPVVPEPAPASAATGRDEDSAAHADASHAWTPAGPGSEACRQAHADVEGLPVGPARRHALHRELTVCAEPLAASCQRAWDAVATKPLGPLRANARRHAREVCARSNP